MIKAIVFDFDGLILDTESSWYDVYCEIYKEIVCNAYATEGSSPRS
jgi:putative hydrolase of the HAD superfamily